MKKAVLVTVAIVTMSSFGFAGGDIEPVETVPFVEAEVSPFYVGLGLSAVSTRDSDESWEPFKDKIGQEDTGDILLMAGYEFNQYIAVEGRYMTSVFGEDDITRDSWGIYVKPQYPATDAFTLYALLGYGGLNADGKGIHFVKVNDTGFQWGLGASYDLNTHFSIFFDYVNIANDMDADLFRGSFLEEVDSDALSVGIPYHF